MTVHQAGKIDQSFTSVKPINESELSPAHSNNSSTIAISSDSNTIQGKCEETITSTPNDQRGNSEEVLIKVTLKPLSGSPIEVEVRPTIAVLDLSSSINRAFQVDKQDTVMDLRTVLMDSPGSAPCSLELGAGEGCGWELRIPSDFDIFSGSP